MLSRRALLIAFGAATLFQGRARAQSSSRIYRLGLLLTTSREFITTARMWQAFEKAFQDLGYVEGRNLIIEGRFAEGREERLPGLAAELVALKVDIIVAGNDLAALAAKNASGTIPIVFALAGDPVGIGLVKSLARPGGNVTGLASFTESTIGKQLELLVEAFPGIGRVAVIHSSRAAASSAQLATLRDAASKMKLRVELHDVSAGPGLEGAFRTIEKERPDALQVLASIPTFVERERIAQFAAARSLPAVYGLSEHVASGGLMSYSISLTDNYRRAAGYVDKILKGAKPADLPVEQPSKFELTVNLKTARALGRPFAPSILLRADRMIE